GVQTPLKSGSFARTCQSAAVGPGLIGSFAAGPAACSVRHSRPVRTPTMTAGSARLREVFMRLEVTLFESHNEALVNARVALEVLRDRRRAQVLDSKIRQCDCVQPEARVVGGEHQPAGWAQQLQ